jgi:hypothetical protein
MKKIKLHSLTDVDINGKIVVLKKTSLRREFRTLVHRIVRASSGFGCNPKASGSAVFTKGVFDNDEARWTRSDFEGWMTEEELVELCNENKELVWVILNDGRETATDRILFPV